MELLEHRKHTTAEAHSVHVTSFLSSLLFLSLVLAATVARSFVQRRRRLRRRPNVVVFVVCGPQEDSAFFGTSSRKRRREAVYSVV